MKKNKAFTLIEVLIATTLLSFVILMSSALFDNAIKATPELKNAVLENSQSASNIEEGILVVKEAYRYHSSSSKNPKDKPKNYDEIIGKDVGKGDKGAPIEIEIQGGLEITSSKGSKTKISKVKGYFVSVSEKETDKVKYNNVIEGDKAFTFVSTGYKPSPSATVENVYVQTPSRFKYFSLYSEEDEVLPVKYIIKNDLYRDNVQAARLRFMRSPISSNKYIYSIFDDGYAGKLFPNTLTLDIFDYIGDEKDSKNKMGTDESYVIYKYGDNELSKKRFLNSIDRTYGASVVLFNLNGHISNEKTTFENIKNDKQNSIHYIGLPIINELSSHYDYNLALSKSKKDDSKYYSLFDINNKDNIVKGDLLSKDGTRYIFDWKNNDIRNLIGIVGVKKSNIKIPQGFLNEVNQTDNLGILKNTLDYNKPYGNTVYYRMNNKNESIRIPAKEENFTFFVKYNPDNYNEIFNHSKERYPYTILSYNFDYSTGNLVSKNSVNKGFILYVDKEGFINYLELNKRKNPEFEKKPININESNLYTDSKHFKFESLAYNGDFKDKRDDRNGFNILSIVKNGKNIKVYILQRDINKKNIETKKVEIASINIDNINEQLVFGSLLSRVIKAPRVTEFVDNYDRDPVMEISDIIMYSEALSHKDVDVTMDYLYRKYLTDKERDDFDKSFVKKY